ncbi:MULTISPECIES: ROK family transcriptional regulator [Streptosporangium]|jgi:predicted NBD/HSP70 family sugar kinase|uniref:Sugar kinase of the NBD/HSP70 family, may contain an N-terminal HTH domain n=1 Tax=Streptosporangium subroseum TaxID=106412 RepID=A0A239MAW5_9ACTN|nr:MULTISPECIES: ROK family transcriptional regulator [Streptosporangium]AWS41439.1 ROK family transcriptional regulator [Streptosporangium sp. 'caverna']WSA15123.1 ROK family protein [Streptosporangium subroseum]SNT39322.1 Sugar kinase of the NBD/HSP70 family, may contain an N-terminal HTH domain [Streptosporangium subroseum]
MERRPGVPRLLREINDRAALELLLASGPLTRGQIGELTGLSKVTASQTLARLEGRGLVEVAGEQAGGRGPNAALYGIISSSAYVAGLDVGPEFVTTAIADIHGEIVAEVKVAPNGHDDPVALVHSAVVKACRSAKVALSKLRAVVIGTPGVVDPRSGDVRFSFDLPGWHEGIHERLARDLRRDVKIENDVNLVALAERTLGAARDADDFVLLWVGRGIGLGVVLGGRLHRGRSGSAGEIGYLPVPGVPLAEDVRAVPGRLPSLAGGLQSLVSAEAVAELAETYGFSGGSAAECVAAAVKAGERGEPLLNEIAGRLALGVASVCVVLDPGLVVLAGEVSQAGGSALTSRIEEAVARMCPIRPQVVPTAVAGNPVLRGAVLAALDQAREEIFAS